MEPALALVLVHTAIVGLSRLQVEPSILMAELAQQVLVLDKVGIVVILQ